MHGRQNHTTPDHEILAASLDPKDLATIELDNLQENGPEHAFQGLILKDDDPEGPELHLRRSPISIPLFQLAGKSPKLHNLQLRNIGQNFPYEQPPRADSVDELIHKDCAGFLISVRATLKTLVFQQDVPGYWNMDEAGQLKSRKDVRRLYRETVWFIKHERTMDRSFQELLLPVLLEDKWEAFRKLEIRGIGPVVVKGLEERLGAWCLTRRS